MSLCWSMILLALVVLLPLCGLLAHRAIEAGEQVLAEARATVVRLAELAEVNLPLRIQPMRRLVLPLD